MWPGSQSDRDELAPGPAPLPAHGEQVSSQREIKLRETAGIWGLGSYRSRPWPGLTDNGSGRRVPGAVEVSKRGDGLGRGGWEVRRTPLKIQ